ncbi:MAG: sugar ABC transporter ATP-binding protein [Actinobacteria bacterium]|nr:sugar ABC transporter ATP-binding protein [Actinomycetota bacterium]
MSGHHEAVLEVRQARKNFGPITALNGVDLVLRRGEILALLGDNGAGKSTLVKAISGAHGLDSGEIALEGRPVSMRSSRDARAHGIETVYQDLAVFDNLTAQQNFHLGREVGWPSWMGPLALLRRKEMVADWQERCKSLQVVIKNDDQPVGLMSGGQRQVVAVARAVAFASRIVILDEPTAALGQRESRRVLELVKRLPGHGVAVILVSHNLEQVMQVADRAIVLRQGVNVGEAEPTPANHQHIVSMIVGAAG